MQEIAAKMKPGLDFTFSGLNKNTAQLCVKHPAFQPDQALILSGRNQPIDIHKSSQNLRIEEIRVQFQI